MFDFRSLMFKSISQKILRSSYKFLIGLVVAIILKNFGFAAFFDAISALLSEADYLGNARRTELLVAPKIAAVLIDKAEFMDSFGRKSPLDRCVLADMLGRLVENSAARIVVDLDVAPVVRASSEELRCQDQLERLIFLNKDRIWLMEPVLSESFDWRDNLKKTQKINFVKPWLTLNFGLLGPQEVKNLDILSIFSLEEHLHSDFLMDFKKRNDGSILKISFEGVKLGRLAVYHVSDLSELKSLPVSFIIFGGGWDSRDKFITPLAFDTPGAIIHAAVIDTYLFGRSDGFGKFLSVSLFGFFISAFVLTLHRKFLGAVEADRDDWESRGILQSRGFFSFFFVFSIFVLIFIFLSLYLYIFDPVNTILPELFLFSFSHLIVSMFVPGFVGKEGALLLADYYKHCRVFFIIIIERYSLLSARERFYLLGWFLKWIIPIVFVVENWRLL